MVNKTPSRCTFCNELKSNTFPGPISCVCLDCLESPRTIQARESTTCEFCNGYTSAPVLKMGESISGLCTACIESCSSYLRIKQWEDGHPWRAKLYSSDIFTNLMKDGPLVMLSRTIGLVLFCVGTVGTKHPSYESLTDQD